MLNRNRNRNSRTQRHSAPHQEPPRYQEPYSNQPPVYYQEPSRHPEPERKPRKRRSRFFWLKTILILIGLITVCVVLMRYVIVPVLVLLPQWLGGAA